MSLVQMWAMAHITALHKWSVREQHRPKVHYGQEKNVRCFAC